MNQDKRKLKNERPNDALNRLIDTVQFLYTRKADLQAVREELIQMKKEAQKLKNQIPFATRNSLVFTIESLIDSLIQEVEIEIETRKKKEEQNKQVKNPNAVKIKIFKSAFSDVVEKEMNDFLNNNNIEIINTLQNLDKEIVCITLFYK
jgi:maleate cis-trans isomerase